MKFNHDTNQTRKLGLPIQDSDPDQMEFFHPVTTQHGHNPEKLERCVRKVKAKGGVRSPWAVCVASTGLKPHH